VDKHLIVGFGPMSPSLNNLTIIVVEDDNEVRKHVGAFLDRSGAKVVVARNGTEGLEAVKNSHPNMVLSDIKMPGMDGFGLLREIRALGPDTGGSVSVIAMTPLITQGERASMLYAGFQACLPKPFTPDSLLETILTVLND
jgi:CheY-like chemotaxis protein